MTDRPLIFTGPLVTALLAERKTVTRRVVRRDGCTIDGGSAKQDHWNALDFDNAWPDAGLGDGGYLKVPCGASMHGEDVVHRVRTRFAVGDMIWVRENWAITGCGRRVPLDEEHWPEGWPIARLIYKADGGHFPTFSSRPAIHMPRWATRVLLEVTDIRVERLREIDGDDVLREGISIYEKPLDPHVELERMPDEEKALIKRFAGTWNDLHRHGNQWDDDPWVWRIAFKLKGARR